MAQIFVFCSELGGWVVIVFAAIVVIGAVVGIADHIKALIRLKVLAHAVVRRGWLKGSGIEMMRIPSLSRVGFAMQSESMAPCSCRY